MKLRTLLLSAVLALCSLSAFAQNLCPAGTIPTGGMTLYYQAKPVGGCAGWQGLGQPPNGATQFALPTLDGNGAYSVGGSWMDNVPAGDYCFYVFYGGDAKCAATNLAPVVKTVVPPPFKGPVVITFAVSPDPITQGTGGATFSGTVAPQ